MKRPFYFQQVAPPPQTRQRGGMIVLTPPRLVFRPTVAEVAFLEAVAREVPPAARTTGVRPPHGMRETSTAPNRPPMRDASAPPSRGPVAQRPDVSHAAHPAPRFAPTPRQAPPLSDLPALTPPQARAPASISTQPVRPQIRSPRPIDSFVSPNVELREEPAGGRTRAAPAAETPRERADVAQAFAVPRAPEPPPHGRALEPSSLPLIVPPALAVPVRAAPARAPTPPSLHIGKLEIHVVPSVAAPQAPIARPRLRATTASVPSGRLARGFGVFGLGQT
jgi:hypothetical protein